MKKDKERICVKSRFKGFRFAGLTFLAAVSGIGIVIAVSAQTETTKPNAEKENKKTVTTKTNDPLRQAPKIDPKTGQVRPLTPREAKEMADSLKEMLSQSQEGLTEVKNADGSVSIDLKGRFQNVTIAKKNADGSVDHSCVDNAESAAAFFGIDPELVKSDNNSTNEKK